jgi:hypothetical protein
MPPGVTALWQVIDGQIQGGSQIVHDVRLFKKDRIIWRKEHKLPPQIGHVVREPERDSHACSFELPHRVGHKAPVDVDNDLTVGRHRRTGDVSLTPLIKGGQRLPGEHS